MNDREGPEEPWEGRNRSRSGLRTLKQTKRTGENDSGRSIEGDPGDSDLVKAVAAANDDSAWEMKRI